MKVVVVNKVFVKRRMDERKVLKKMKQKTIFYSV